MGAENLIERHAAWLQSRARRLSRTFRAEFDDCLSMLTVYLLERGSQKTAWLAVYRDLKRQAGIQANERQLDQELPENISEIDHVEFRDFLQTHLDLTEIHLIEMVIEGKTQQEIANELGMSQQHVSTISREAFEVIRQEWQDAT